MHPKERLIFPLDVPDGEQARHFIKLLKDEVGLFKVGLELFVAEGPQFFQTVAQEAGAGFFLDLKFHDIPETVKGAQKNLFRGARFTTIHCEQGPRLLQATVASRSWASRFSPAWTLRTCWPPGSTRNMPIPLKNWFCSGPPWQKPPAAAAWSAPPGRPGR
jgi:hypothetical protein